jgi:hypothetical protein
LATSADFIHDLLGWDGIWWGMTEDSVAETLADHLVPLSPPVQFAHLHAPFKGVLAIGSYPFEGLPQFWNDSGTLAQVLVRANDADPARIATLRDALTRRYGSPLESGRKAFWRVADSVIELDSVAAPHAATWMRCYPIPPVRQRRSA